MVDISRDKVPTTDSLKALIDRLASLKVNQVQLYSEHTFAYENHGVVHAQASPLDADGDHASSTPTAGPATSSWCRTRTAWAI